MAALRLNLPVCKIDMTPFTGVVIVLFVSMAVTAPPFHGAGVDLPRVDHPIPMADANREDALIVAIMRDGKVFFGNDQVASGELGAKVARRMASSGHRRLYIKADARVRYRSVKAALDGIWAGGVQEVGILTEQRRALAR